MMCACLASANPADALSSSVTQFIGDPIYITNAAQYGMGTNPGVGADNDDATYTLVRARLAQPLRSPFARDLR